MIIIPLIDILYALKIFETWPNIFLNICILYGYKIGLSGYVFDHILFKCTGT